jgi:hypothetical protein
MGTLTSWNPLGHSRPVTGLIYLFFPPFLISTISFGRFYQKYIILNNYIKFSFPSFSIFNVNLKMKFTYWQYVTEKLLVLEK